MAGNVDDYLNALTLGFYGSATDRYRVSREFLSYVVDSTVAPVGACSDHDMGCIASRLLEVNGLAEAGKDEIFIRTIPLIYGWAAAIIVPLVIRKRGSVIGHEKAEKRARETVLHLLVQNRHPAGKQYKLLKMPRSSISRFRSYFDCCDDSF